MNDEDIMIADALADPSFVNEHDDELEEDDEREPEIDEINYDYHEWDRNSRRPIVKTEG